LEQVVLIACQEHLKKLILNLDDKELTKMALEFATNGASSNSTLVFGENFPLLDLPGFAIDIIIDILDKRLKTKLRYQRFEFTRKGLAEVLEHVLDPLMDFVTLRNLEHSQLKKNEETPKRVELPKNLEKFLGIKTIPSSNFKIIKNYQQIISSTKKSNYPYVQEDVWKSISDQFQKEENIFISCTDNQFGFEWCIKTSKEISPKLTEDLFIFPQMKLSGTTPLDPGVVNVALYKLEEVAKLLIKMNINKKKCIVPFDNKCRICK